MWGYSYELVYKNSFSSFYDISEKKELPEEIVAVGRGMVYEELTEIFAVKNELEAVKKFAFLAYQDLSKNAWFVKLEPQRLEKMKQLSS